MTAALSPSTTPQIFAWQVPSTPASIVANSSAGIDPTDNVTIDTGSSTCFSLAGDTLAAGASCTVKVDGAADATVGAYTVQVNNTGSNNLEEYRKRRGIR